ncbi:hypothetical protein ACFX15_037888 [Malus domestica]
METRARPQPMRLVGFIGGRTILVSVASESALNLISTSIVGELGLEVDRNLSLSFPLANGTAARTDDVVSNLRVEIEVYEYVSDFHVSPLPDCDVVFGADWLESLGAVVWNFREKWMKFTVDGIKHTLVGVGALERIWSISRMPVCEDKSHEEFRWEDYQLGNRGGEASTLQSMSSMLVSEDKSHEELRWEYYQFRSISCFSGSAGILGQNHLGRFSAGTQMSIHRGGAAPWIQYGLSTMPLM